MSINLSPLPPDLTFVALSQSEADVLFSFGVKKDAMGEYIAARWGWDETYQFRIHQQRFEAKPFFAVLKEGEAIGTLSWVVGDEYSRFGEFYLLKQFRRAGLGTRILVHSLAHADRIGCPVRLEYLKWNPVGSLYRRHGFADIYATETHFHLERPAFVP